LETADVDPRHRHPARHIPLADQQIDGVQRGERAERRAGDDGYPAQRLPRFGRGKRFGDRCQDVRPFRVGQSSSLLIQTTGMKGTGPDIWKCPPGGTSPVMRLLIIADTHVPKRARALPAEIWHAAESVDVVVHAGDWVEVSLLDELKSR